MRNRIPKQAETNQKARCNAPIAATDPVDCEKTQATGAHKMKAGKYFLHFGVYGNGKHKVTAKVYRAVGKPDYTKHHNDVLVQTTPRAADDRGVSWMANPKKYAKGTYYIVFSYSVKGKKAFGGVQAG